VSAEKAHNGRPGTRISRISPATIADTSTSPLRLAATTAVWSQRRFVSRPLRSGSGAGLAVLTARERESVALVAQGLSNEEIAARMVISPMTAKTHVNRAMAKLGARDRAQLVVLAYESGLVVPDGPSN